MGNISVLSSEYIFIARNPKNFSFSHQAHFFSRKNLGTASITTVACTFDLSSATGPEAISPGSELETPCA